MELFEGTIHQLHEMLRKKEVSSEEITKSVLRRIDEVEDKVHSYITVTREEALQRAREVDGKIARGEDLAPLDGIPIALKDLFVTKGITTTCGSNILNNFVPPYDGTAVEKVKAHGAVIIGKTNMDEFAMGSSTETSFFGVTRNPWDLDRVPGGSSGGSASSVAAQQCIASLGTDTGGSVRQPAAFCGVVGMKPTYGRVSRYGIVAFASSLDQVGPITRDVRDNAILLKAVSGYDPRDSTSINEPVPDYAGSLREDVKGMVLGIPKEYFVEGIDPEVESAVRSAIEHLGNLGAEVKEISLPHTEYAAADYYIIAPAEASSNLARYDGVKYGFRAGESTDLMEMYVKSRSAGFGEEVKRRIMIGTYALSAGYYDAYYLKALKVRTLIRRDFEEAFKTCDAIVTPTAPTAAFKLGENLDDPLQMYLGDILNLSVNLSGLPGMSLPCGFTTEGLPIGLQIIAGSLNEEIIYRVAHTYEQSTDWHTRKAPL